MRHLSIVILISFLALATAPVPLLADEPTHSCAKAEKSRCHDENCCTTAACCKDKSCSTKKTTEPPVAVPFE